MAFPTSLPSGDVLQAVGAAAASLTGPTNQAAQAAILAGGSRDAPPALNALEVAVVGLPDVLPATADGLPGVARATHHPPVMSARPVPTGPTRSRSANAWLNGQTGIAAPGRPTGDERRHSLRGRCPVIAAPRNSRGELSRRS